MFDRIHRRPRSFWIQLIRNLILEIVTDHPALALSERRHMAFDVEIAIRVNGHAKHFEVRSAYT